jgi:soluble lytic murein transglycosylase-like protein
MLSLRASICIVIGEFVILSAMSAGQRASAPSPGSADQPFAAIQNSLALAADSALHTVQVEDPTATPRHNAPKTNADTYSKSQRNPQVMLGRFDALRSAIEPILAREGVPQDLAAVIVVESGGNPFALSPKGARGLWQLMPDTARRYGLRVDSRADDRTDVTKSTTAATRYLRDLYNQFGSWPLALAAYNTGEHNLQRAINRAGSNEFATLSFLHYIPDETRNYVPAVLAAMAMPSIAPCGTTEQTNREPSCTRPVPRSFALISVELELF